MARAALVATLVANPWLFALGTPLWVTALTAPPAPPATNVATAQPKLAAASVGRPSPTPAVA
ncbi:MAG: hypothetical protein ACLFU0_09210 [Alphaproteobacteria bacterium]